MNRNQKTITFFICSLFIFNFGNYGYPQVTKLGIKPKTTPAAVVKTEAEIDSLNEVINHLKDSYDRAVRINKGKDSLIDELDAKILKNQQLSNDLERKLSDYKGDNLKLDQSNRILIIFNAIVGLLLLTTLIWFLRNIGKKKAPDKNKVVSSNDAEAVLKIKSQPVAKNDGQYFDLKLEQLERLGALKDKGVLSEEEFKKQKQQILGNS